MKSVTASKLLPALLGGLLLAGCASVTSRAPVGDRPVTLDPQKWNGAWTDGEEALLLFRVKDATNGVLEVGFVEVNENEMGLKKLDVHIRKTGDWWWASFKEEVDTAFTFMRVSEPGAHVLAWRPEPAAFAERVKAGTLKGELVKDEQGKDAGSVILDELKGEPLQAIESGEWRGVLNLDDPAMILRRLGSAPKP